jgi:uncharacterized protein (TIGR02246 family)
MNEPPQGNGAVTDRDADLQAIERLHEADRRATLALDTDALIDLWTHDGVMLRPGSPPVVGKEAIAETIRAWNPDPDEIRIIQNDIDFTEIKVVGDWAFEYGTYESKWRASDTGTVQSSSGNLLRVLRRQADGSWKCARAIWNLHEDQTSP